ncbi:MULTISPECIES: L-rhamnose mutarotase [Pseudoalteromonas]|uniref:L-rhamnose mutarotase n=1 Tax=Pseudoalteromonas TaxID=53246 RepID=UPI0006CA1959|nr:MULTISPECIES: L-rhamnose mutarotase [Pseudoalteromonas]KPM75839.1 L-fucose mutarotase [Pseudoalteromonas sp. UCD-33C]KPW03671.1 L-fucose mutarotase [Pseudoalteromonas sp. P1-8]MDK9684823.1 L-rhamnose mutarotase [Pseudoalteromonas shioyasakiensis]|tara:strand:+ start:201 stop:542 length:342 start_codon:yes stop_codon:yes gene_type:complete
MQYCLTLELKDDPKLIAQYEEYHKAGCVWPEVVESIRHAGIEDMSIYRHGTLLIMILNVDDSFSFEKKAQQDLSNDKVQQWEKLMEQFQRVDKATEEQDKWRIVERIFSLQAQ